MKLQDYISTKKMKQKVFALKIGISPAFMCQLVKGIRRPGADIALRIEEATDGQVTVLELLYPDRKAA